MSLTPDTRPIVIRVLVVAHSIVMRAGLETLITTEPTLAVVGSIAYSASLAQQIEQLQPDVVLLEWMASDEEPLPTPIAADWQAPALVLLMDEIPSSTVSDFLRMGVRGILPSEATASEIIGAIAAAAAGLTILHPDVADALLPVLPTSSNGLRTEADQPADTLPQPLTTREIEVLGMLAEGVANKTIARRLNLSEHTVKFHISSIFSKLNASSRTEAVILGARLGLVLL